MDEKEKQKEIIEIDVIETSTNGELRTEDERNLSASSMEELIQEMHILSLNNNIFSVSKKAEEIRILFYIKLKQHQKEKIERRNITETVPDREKIQQEVEVKISPDVSGEIVELLMKEGNIKDIEESEEIEESQEKPKKSVLNPLEIAFRKCYNSFKREKAKIRKEKEVQEEKNLLQKRQIIEDIDNLTKQEESIRKTFEQFRELQEKWKKVGHVPIVENNNLWKTYHHHVELFYDFIKINKDLRDLDFKRNLEEKITICEKAEALLNEKSLNKMHDTLQELHEHWKNIGPVEKEKRNTIWDRFQTITKTLHKKRNDYFLLKKEKNDKKLETKNSICKAIDNLTDKLPASHNGWQQLIVESKKLEEKWKSLGRLGKKENLIAWRNLRDSLDNFYKKKNDFYKNRKKDSENVITKKTAICEKAEILKEDTNWKETTRKLIQLQEDWKNTGFSPKKTTDKLWKRFKSACNVFFNAKKVHFKEIEKAKEENLKAKQNILKEAKKFLPSTDGKVDIKILTDFSKEWRKCGFVSKNKQSIEQDFEKIMNKHFDVIKLDKKQVEEEKFKSRLSAINGNKVKLEKEKSLIKAKMDDVKKVITQYENNISFFGKNKRNDILKKEVENKIESAQKEVGILKKKLILIDRH